VCGSCNVPPFCLAATPVATKKQDPAVDGFFLDIYFPFLAQCILLLSGFSITPCYFTILLMALDGVGGSFYCFFFPLQSLSSVSHLFSSPKKFVFFFCFFPSWHCSQFSAVLLVCQLLNNFLILYVLFLPLALAF